MTASSYDPTRHPGARDDDASQNALPTIGSTRSGRERSAVTRARPARRPYPCGARLRQRAPDLGPCFTTSADDDDLDAAADRCLGWNWRAVCCVARHHLRPCRLSLDRPRNRPPGPVIPVASVRRIECRPCNRLTAPSVTRRLHTGSGRRRRRIRRSRRRYPTSHTRTTDRLVPAGNRARPRGGGSSRCNRLEHPIRHDPGSQRPRLSGRGRTADCRALAAPQSALPWQFTDRHP